jgi:hypothetical protein
MSDSRRTYRAIKGAIQQLCPCEPQGNQARHLNTLVGMITGIVLSKSCQLPKVAGKVPEAAKPESRTKRFSRWVQTETIAAELYFLPFVATLLSALATSQPQVVFMMDGSEVGRGCLALVVSVLYAHRALPVAWLVVKGKKGHFPTDAHVQLLHQVIELVPAETAAVFLGMGNSTALNCRRPWIPKVGTMPAARPKISRSGTKALGRIWKPSGFVGGARRCGGRSDLLKPSMGRCKSLAGGVRSATSPCIWSRISLIGMRPACGIRNALTLKPCSRTRRAVAFICT